MVAEIKQLEQEDVIRATALNAELIFGIGKVKSSPQIVYRYRGELYLNLTNKCSNRCEFCFSHHSDYFAGYSLRLRKEPSVKEIIKAVEKEKLDRKEVTFCGYGEPFMRLQELKEIAKALKKKGYSIRVVTNGQGNLIAGRNVLPELEGLVDKISISLDFPDEDKYNQICKPEFGKGTYRKIMEFIQEAKKHIPWVEITFLDAPGIELARCKEIARSLGVSFRIREFYILR
jgi:TatD DNase family protein